ncbi:MAG: LamG domain-containing protein [Thermoguttaceae bacterium]|jgi:hypothetical protein|nr:LamG domain-containing protein [Thermoguttaceae bacterium]
MKSPTLLLAMALIPLATIPSVASPLVLYENDFNTRASVGALDSSGEVGPVDGLYTFDYSIGNLILASRYDAGQDLWIRRNTGSAVCTVAAGTPADNQYAQFATTTSYGYALQPIGSQINEGMVRISTDILSPASWTHSSKVSQVRLGDDDFYAGSLDSNDLQFYRQTASTFGFGDTGGNNRFTVTDGDGSGGITNIYGAVEVKTHNWYRFVADLDLYSNTYSVNVYDLGPDHPTLATPTPKAAVETFSNLRFRRDLGNTQNDLNGITTVGIASFGNASPVGYDNIVISDPRHEYVHHVADTSPAVYWQFEDTFSSYSSTNRAADTAMLLGGKNEGFGVRRTTTIPLPGAGGNGIRDDAIEFVKGNALGYDALNSVAGVAVDNYSVQMWVKSTAEIALYKSGDPQSTLNQSLNYFFARSHANPANVSNSNDAVRWQLPDNLNLSGYLVDSPRLSYVSWDLNGGSATAETDDGDGLDGRPLTTVTPITHDEWYHVVFVREPSGWVSVYLDGKLEIYKYDPLSSGAYTYEGEYLLIGDRANYGSFANYGLAGLMDEVAVWGRALTAEEVRDLYRLIPEPGTLLLLALAGLCLLPFRRR